MISKIFGVAGIAVIASGAVRCSVEDSAPFDRSFEKWGYYTGQNAVFMLNAIALGVLSGVNEILSENSDREIIIDFDENQQPVLIGFVEPDGTHMILQPDGSFQELDMPKEHSGHDIAVNSQPA
ncbi:MAG: hypothetical protein GW778_03400 [Alphaproteobacteria bacterium]|nr:hypothetical protein [Alphaproteobacteria bacterium]